MRLMYSPSLIPRAALYFDKAEQSGTKLTQAELMERSLDQDVGGWAKAKNQPLGRSSISPSLSAKSSTVD